MKHTRLRVRKICIRCDAVSSDVARYLVAYQCSTHWQLRKQSRKQLCRQLRKKLYSAHTSSGIRKATSESDTIRDTSTGQFNEILHLSKRTDQLADAREDPLRKYDARTITKHMPRDKNYAKALVEFIAGDHLQDLNGFCALRLCTDLHCQIALIHARPSSLETYTLAP